MREIPVIRHERYRHIKHAAHVAFESYMNSRPKKKVPAIPHRGVEASMHNPHNKRRKTHSAGRGVSVNPKHPKQIFKHKKSHVAKNHKKPYIPKLVADDIHSGITSEKFNLTTGHKVPKKGWEKHAPAKLHEVYFPGLGTSGLDSQFVLSLGQCGRADQFIGQSSSTANHDTFTRTVFDMNADAANTGSAVFGAASNWSTNQAYIDHCSFKITCSNLGSFGAYVTIYVAQAKTYIPKPADGTVVNQFNTALIEDIWTECIHTNDMGQGNMNLATGAAGNEQKELVDSNPFQVPAFRKLFKPLKIHKINLGAGAEETVDFHVNMNIKGDCKKLMVMNSGIIGAGPAYFPTNVIRLANNQVRYSLLPGGVYVFATFHGVLGKDVGGTLKAHVGSAEIAWMVERKMNFRFVKDRSKQDVPTTAEFNNPAATGNVSRVDITDVVNGLKAP